MINPSLDAIDANASDFLRALSCLVQTTANQPSTLSVASISDGFTSSESLKNRLDDAFNSLSESSKSFIPVVSAALLITSSAVGASMMVLPDLARGPGLIVSSGIIGGELGLIQNMMQDMVHSAVST